MSIKRNNRKATKVFLVVILVLLAFSLNVMTMFSQEVVDDLSTEIKDLNFDTTSNQLNISVSIKNKTDVFIGNLGYSIELYLGDTLAEEGYLFDNLTHQITESGEIGNLEPGESLDTTLTMTPPSTIQSGNYFARVVVGDETLNYVALDYTEEPFQLTGQGNYLGAISSYFRTPHGDDLPMSGWLIDSTETPSVIIRLNENKVLGVFLEKNDLYAEVEVYNTSGKEKDVPVYVYQNQKVSPIIDDTEEVIKIDLAPWEGMSAGSYTVRTLLKDENGNLIATPINSRWLVSGFYSRITNVETGTNIYSRGDNVDLVVDVTSAMFADNQNGEVTAIFFDKDSNKEIFKKEFIFDNNLVLNFSDQIFQNNFKPVSVQVSLSSPNFGEELDYFEMEIPQGSVFQRKIESPDNIFRSIVSIALFAIVLLMSIAIVRKQGSKKFYVIVGALLIILLLLFITLPKLDLDKASAAVPTKTDLSFVSARFPRGNLGQCDKVGGIQFYVKANCIACLNGVTGTAAIYRNSDNKVFASLRLGDPGHRDKAGDGKGVHVWGPLKYNHLLTSENNTLTYRAAAVINKGSWCPSAFIKRIETISCTPVEVIEEDVCANIDGIQTSVPDGLVLVGGDQCVPLPDIEASCGVANYGTLPSVPEIEAYRYKDYKANNQVVKWQINKSPTGGDGTYTYEWILSDSPEQDEDARDFVYRTRYNSGGSKTASVKVSSGGQSKVFSCGTAYIDMCDNIGGIQREVPEGLEINNYQCTDPDDGPDDNGNPPNGGDGDPPSSGGNINPPDNDSISKPTGPAEIDFEVKPIIADKDNHCPATWTVSNVTSCEILSDSGINNQVNVSIESGEQTGEVVGGDEYHLECVSEDEQIEVSTKYRCNESKLIEY